MSYVKSHLRKNKHVTAQVRKHFRTSPVFNKSFMPTFLNYTKTKIPGAQHKYKIAKPIDATTPFSWVFGQKDYIWQIKHDGVRAQAYVYSDGTVLFLKTTNQTTAFPELRNLKEYFKFEKNIVLDGEMVVFDKEGVSRYDLVSRRTNRKPPIPEEILRNYPAVFMVFDILELDGKDLTALPLSKRREILESAYRENKSVRLMKDYKDGKKLYDWALKTEFEGVVGKKKNSPYSAGKRRDDWVRVKPFHSMDTVILGYTFTNAPTKKGLFKSVVLGAWDNGKLRIVSNTGTGFKRWQLVELKEKMDKIILKEQKPPTVVNPEMLPREKVMWLKPEFVGRIRFKKLTPKGKAREPSWVGLTLKKATPKTAHFKPKIHPGVLAEEEL